MCAKNTFRFIFNVQRPWKWLFWSYGICLWFLTLTDVQVTQPTENTLFTCYLNIGCISCSIGFSVTPIVDIIETCKMRSITRAEHAWRGHVWVWNRRCPIHKRISSCCASWNTNTTRMHVPVVRLVMQILSYI